MAPWPLRSTRPERVRARNTGFWAFRPSHYWPSSHPIFNSGRPNDRPSSLFAYSTSSARLSSLPLSLTECLRLSLLPVAAASLHPPFVRTRKKSDSDVPWLHHRCPGTAPPPHRTPPTSPPRGQPWVKVGGWAVAPHMAHLAPGAGPNRASSSSRAADRQEALAAPPPCANTSRSLPARARAEDSGGSPNSVSRSPKGSPSQARECELDTMPWSLPPAPQSPRLPPLPPPSPAPLKFSKGGESDKAPKTLLHANSTNGSAASARAPLTPSARTPPSASLPPLAFGAKSRSRSKGSSRGPLCPTAAGPQCINGSSAGRTLAKVAALAPPRCGATVLWVAGAAAGPADTPHAAASLAHFLRRSAQEV